MNNEDKKVAHEDLISINQIIEQDTENKIIEQNASLVIIQQLKRIKILGVFKRHCKKA